MTNNIFIIRLSLLAFSKVREEAYCSDYEL
jgi:hypothetical protein